MNLQEIGPIPKAVSIPDPDFERDEGFREPPLRPADDPGERAPAEQPPPADVRPLRPAGSPPVDPHGGPVASGRCLAGRCALSLAVTPALSALGAAREQARTFLRGFDLPEPAVFDVVLCLEEACKNAIRFSGSDREIDVTVAVSRHEVDLVVRDHGVGFEPRDVDPAVPPDPFETQGRGLFLLNCLMDDVRIARDRGAIVRARKAVAR
jgi:anti-sigma regulatory factor (Ser/Thr protein kinase)